ncbi:MAG: hypothetical protein IPP47_22495 [Bryobacterales bacterium]|nr:hypothetical protein [Bryobacterales bacterium]
MLLAFGILFPRSIIYFFGLFPIEARWYVLIMGAIVFRGALGDSGGSVSHFAHLGGMAFGYAFLKLGLGAAKGRGPVIRFSLREGSTAAIRIGSSSGQRRSSGVSEEARHQAQ